MLWSIPFEGSGIVFFLFKGKMPRFFFFFLLDCQCQYMAILGIVCQLWMVEIFVCHNLLFLWYLYLNLCSCFALYFFAPSLNFSCIFFFFFETLVWRKAANVWMLVYLYATDDNNSTTSTAAYNYVFHL